MKEAKKKLYTALEVEATSREVVVMEAKQKVVANFKESEEYKLSTQDFDMGYDKGIEEIFYNIWRKRRSVCYKFLGKEYRKQIAIWEDQEWANILDTRPHSSSDYSNDECEILEDHKPDNSNTQEPLVDA